MKNIVDPKNLSGVLELLPNEQIMMNKVEKIIRKNFEKFGFLPLDTPIIESTEVLLAKAGGETEKQIYSFKKGSNDLALRFDLTVPLAKYVAANYNNLVFPFRRYQIGKVYRGERPQKGRFREFYQCDIDVVGDGTLDVRYDAEFPMVIYNVFNQLEIGDFTIELSNRKLLSGYLRELGLLGSKDEIFKYIDKYDKIGKENVIACLLDEAGLSQEEVSKVLKFVEISGTNLEKLQALADLNIKDEDFLQGLKELEIVINAPMLAGLPEKNFEINLTIVRGLDYYTGTIYEVFLKDLRNIGSVCSGGRYDNLAENFTNRKLPGVGISIGLTRLFSQLIENNLLKQSKSYISEILILPFDERAYGFSLKLASALRAANINCETYLNQAKLKTMLNYANRKAVPYVAILGEEELAQDKVLVKNMETGEQKLLSIDEVIEFLK